MAIFTKKGKRFDTTGRVLYGPVPTNNVFKGFGGACEATQQRRRRRALRPARRPLADRDADLPRGRRAARPAGARKAGRAGARERARRRPASPARRRRCSCHRRPPPRAAGARAGSRRAGAGRAGSRPAAGRRARTRCATRSARAPIRSGSYYRYEFLRPLFPDYPRPAIWPDGYYVPTSTGDDVIQKHACVVDRAKMLKGEPATEQCVIIDGVNFLNNADLDGKALPPPGAPNIMMAAGGTQLKKDLRGRRRSTCGASTSTGRIRRRRRSTGPTKIAVAPYHYLCDGQLTNCVPQPGTDRRLDAQGDKIMARLVYRSVGGPRVDRRRALGEHGGGRRRRALVRVPRRTRTAPSRCISRARMRPTASTAGWPARRSTRGQHRHRLLVRRHAALRRPALRRRGSRTTRPGS